MNPASLKPESFSQYAPEAKQLAINHIALLQRLPITFVPVLLLQIQQFDVSFPAERGQLSAEITALESLDEPSFQLVMQGFARIVPPSDLSRMDWVNEPQRFTERLTAWLWSAREIDAYHSAASKYLQQLPASAPTSTGTARWTFVLVGGGIASSHHLLFRKLAPHGTMFKNVEPAGGLEAVMAEASARARQYPTRYGHWYIEGGEPLEVSGLTVTSYNRLVPAARKEFQLLHRFSAERSAAGVESVTSYVASLKSEDLGIRAGTADAALRHFEVALLTQGAGCQIFSTTFVQWAARECLHRAQPLTLVVRFGTRQKLAPLDQLLNRDPLMQPQDPEGSLIDADMGTYYTWINQCRLPKSEDARFLAWWEGQRIAFAASPSLARNTTSDQKCNLQQLLAWIR